MFAAANHKDVVRHTFGDTRFGPCLDNDLKCMIPGGLLDKLFTYAQSNANLDDEENRATWLWNVQASKLTKCDAVDEMDPMISRENLIKAKANLKSERLAGFKGVTVGRLEPRAFWWRV
jgi:hypothetical protein